MWSLKVNQLKLNERLSRRGYSSLLCLAFFFSLSLSLSPLPWPPAASCGRRGGGPVTRSIGVIFWAGDVTVCVTGAAKLSVRGKEVEAREEMLR